MESPKSSEPIVKWGERPSRYTPANFKCHVCGGEVGWLWFSDPLRRARDDWVCFGKVESRQTPGVLVDCLHSYARRKATARL